MRKLLYLVFTVLSILYSHKINAQKVQFGVRAGLDVSEISFSSNIIEEKSYKGWFVGPTAKFSLPPTGLGVDISTLYDCHSVNIKNTIGENMTIKYQQIAIPINLNYSVGLGDIASISFFAGPQWNINIISNEFEWNKVKSYLLNNSTFSINVGLGINVFSNLQIRGSYNIACGKSRDVTFENIANNIIRAKKNNNSWQIGIVLFFNRS